MSSTNERPEVEVPVERRADPELSRACVDAAASATAAEDPENAAQKKGKRKKKNRTEGANEEAAAAQRLNEAAVRHVVDDRMLIVGRHRSIRKVVEYVSGKWNIPGGFNSACSRLSYTVEVVALGKPLAELTNEEIRAGESIETVRSVAAAGPIRVLFDCDLGFFPDCSCAPNPKLFPEHVTELPTPAGVETVEVIEYHERPMLWTEPLCCAEKQFVHQELLADCARLMVDQERSVFFVKEACEDSQRYYRLKIECHEHYSRMRLRPRHALDLCSTLESWAESVDEEKLAAFTFDDRARKSYADAAYLFKPLSATQHFNYPQLLSVLRFRYTIGSDAYEEVATIGLGDMNPWLELALEQSSLNSGEAFLLLPRVQPEDSVDPVKYSRPNVVTPWPDGIAKTELAKKSRTRNFCTSPETVRGAYGVIPASDRLRSWAQTRSGLIVDKLCILSVRFLPSLDDPMYNDTEDDAEEFVDVDSESSDSESAAADDAETDLAVPTAASSSELLQASPENESANEVPPISESLAARMQFISYTNTLARWLAQCNLFHCALMLYDFSLTNLESRDSLKTYERKQPQVLTLRKACTRSKTICLYKLGEPRHALSVALQCLKLAPQDPAVLLWVARAEHATERFAQAEAHLRLALQHASDATQTRLLKTELDTVHRSIQKLECRWTFPEHAEPLYQDRHDHLHRQRLLANLGLKVVPILP